MIHENSKRYQGEGGHFPWSSTVLKKYEKFTLLDVLFVVYLVKPQNHFIKNFIKNKIKLAYKIKYISQINGVLNMFFHKFENKLVLK